MGAASLDNTHTNRLSIGRTSLFPRKEFESNEFLFDELVVNWMNEAKVKISLNHEKSTYFH
jgi:hypothetical protein